MELGSSNSEFTIPGTKTKLSWQVFAILIGGIAFIVFFTRNGGEDATDPRSAMSEDLDREVDNLIDMLANYSPPLNYDGSSKEPPGTTTPPPPPIGTTPPVDDPPENGPPDDPPPGSGGAGRIWNIETNRVFFIPHYGVTLS